MADRYIAILEDDARRQHAMATALSALMPDSQIAMFESSSRMTGWLEDHLHEVTLLSLDHDLPMRRDAGGTAVDLGDGMQVATYLASRPATAPVIVHSTNAPASLNMIATLRHAGWPVDQVVPHDDLRWIRGEWLQIISNLKVRRWFAEAV